MADPAKYKSVSVNVPTYKILKYLSEGKVTEADLTISKTIELLAKKEGKKMDIRTVKVVKEICKDCKGNGFIRVPYEEAYEEMWANCDTCENEGEIVVEKYNII